MFGPKLSLPRHVRISLDPDRKDPTKGRLSITAWNDQQAESESGGMTIPYNIGAIDFGKKLMDSINYLYGRLAGK